MTVSDLKEVLQKIIDDGYGDFYVDCHLETDYTELSKLQIDLINKEVFIG